MLSLRNISKSFWRRGVILDDLSVEFGSGKITALVGKNGAGKSTLLKIALGILQPNKGEVWLAGENISKLPTHERIRRGLGYMSQESTAITDLSVEDNLYLIPNLGREDAKFREALLTDFDLAEVRKRKAKNLSGGELHKLEFCLCMATRPQLILLDEPFAGLDPKTTKLIAELTSSMHSRGVGFAIVDHRVEELRKLAHSYILLHQQRVQFVGSERKFFSSSLVKELFLG